MLKFFASENIIINSILGKYQYSYEILRELKKHDNSLYLIIGADNLEKFHMWKNVNTMLENNVLVINRNGIEINAYINIFEKKDSFVIVKGLEEINISSTEIREKIKNKEDVIGCLDKRVIKYITDNNLYGGG